MNKIIKLRIVAGVLGICLSGVMSLASCVDDQVPCTNVVENGHGCGTELPYGCCFYTEYRCLGTSTVFRLRTFVGAAACGKRAPGNGYPIGYFCDSLVL